MRLLVFLLIPQTIHAEAVLAYVKGRVIYTARAADGQHEQKICVGGSPCISHDGRFLAYTRTNGAPGNSSTRTVVVRELANGKETDLPTGTGRQVFGALWSPDDSWVAYNALGNESWQVAVAHPDGTAFHLLTDKLDAHDVGYFLAGWNLHDGAVLAQNCRLATQLDPATGKVAWTRSVTQLTGGQSASSDTRFTVAVDGQRLIYTRPVDKEEIRHLTDPSCCLVLADLTTGTARRLTPEKFGVLAPYVSTDGESIFLCGFGPQDVRPRRGGDGVDVKPRLYRFDLGSGKLKPLVEGGEEPSVSRD